MASKINWLQVGQDFQQKYQGTYCRYLSPITKKKEVFLIIAVHPANTAPPTISLYNEKHGELHLSYSTEAELDFSHPEVRNFQYGKKAMRFIRNHDRQWKKGVCDATARVVFPYNEIVGYGSGGIEEKVLEAAYKPLVTYTVDQALYILRNEGNVSVAMSPDLSLGHGNKDDEYWLWFHTEPVGRVTGNKVEMKVSAFKQEVQDFLRNTGDYARAVV